jgi:hypothetical protein
MQYPQVNLAGAARGSSIPVLAPLSLHGDAGAIADLKSRLGTGRID